MSETAAADSRPSRLRSPAISTVGRQRPAGLRSTNAIRIWTDGKVTAVRGDAATECLSWPAPTVIVSDGGYGVLGFDGDTAGHADLPHWYEPHIAAWSSRATPQTTLWFWNSEIGWAAVHPVLERFGWRYVNANVWDKGHGHIAGNVHTGKIRRFPVVSEVCVQYVFEARVQGLTLKQWLLREWKRTRLPLREANAACGVADAATRKYLDQSHLWYFPPPDVFERLQRWANERGDPAGRPYFSLNGIVPASADDWARQRAKFDCPYGYTNVWSRPALRGAERIRLPGGRAVHLNQKPLDLMKLIIEAASDPGDVVWEPFGGLFSASVAARSLNRRSFASELDAIYYDIGVARLADFSVHPESITEVKDQEQLQLCEEHRQHRYEPRAADDRCESLESS